MLTFSYLGAMIALVQGLLVWSLVVFIPESALAVVGAVLQVLGFGAMTAIVQTGSLVGLLAALTLLVVGLVLLTPSLNSLISRHSDAADQGCVLGLGQSVGSLARILGPLIGIPLLNRPFVLPLALPYLTGAGLMGLGLVTIITALRSRMPFALANRVEATWGIAEPDRLSTCLLKPEEI